MSHRAVGKQIRRPGFYSFQLAVPDLDCDADVVLAFYPMHFSSGLYRFPIICGCPAGITAGAIGFALLSAGYVIPDVSGAH